MGHLDGYESVQLLVVGPIDQPEAAPAGESLDAITPDPLGEVGSGRRNLLWREDRRAIARQGRRECGLNQVSLMREPVEILLHARAFPSLPTQFDLQGQQLPEQVRTHRLPELSEDEFD